MTPIPVGRASDLLACSSVFTVCFSAWMVLTQIRENLSAAAVTAPLPQVSVVCAPPALKKLSEAFPGLKVYTGEAPLMRQELMMRS